MPALLTALLINRWSWAALGLAAALGFAGLQTARLEHAKAALRDPATRGLWKDEARAAADALSGARADLATCRGGLSRLQGALDVQNRALAVWKAQSDADSAAAAGAARGALAAARSARAAAAKVLTSRSGADACASADGLILQSLGGG